MGKYDFTKFCGLLGDLNMSSRKKKIMTFRQGINDKIIFYIEHACMSGLHPYYFYTFLWMFRCYSLNYIYYIDGCEGVTRTTMALATLFHRVRVSQCLNLRHLQHFGKVGIKGMKFVYVVPRCLTFSVISIILPPILLSPIVISLPLCRWCSPKSFLNP